MFGDPGFERVLAQATMVSFHAYPFLQTVALGGGGVGGGEARLFPFLFL
jgi:hypothetical protein